MLAISLPAPQTPPVPDFSVGVTLDSIAYTLRFVWNDRDGIWYVRVLDNPGQTVLMYDQRLIVDWPLYRNQIDRNPPGYLILYDTSGQGIDPGIGDLGQGARCQLLYVTVADLAAIGIPV